MLSFRSCPQKAPGLIRRPMAPSFFQFHVSATSHTTFDAWRNFKQKYRANAKPERDRSRSGLVIYIIFHQITGQAARSARRRGGRAQKLVELNSKLAVRD